MSLIMNEFYNRLYNKVLLNFYECSTKTEHKGQKYDGQYKTLMEMIKRQTYYFRIRLAFRADVVADAEGYACSFGNGAALLYFLGGQGFLHYREDDLRNVLLNVFRKGDEGSV